jgi:murein DD-endopeptidase MepM/ murein hydrolase activator NlpD
MISSNKREFCLWVVGSKDGRVRKLRFTLKTLLAALVVLGGIASGFLFVASDYARAHIQRAESYFKLKRVLHEKEQLEGTRETLESKVEHLETAQQRSLSYEQQVKARLDELASLLRASDPGRVLAPSLGVKGLGVSAAQASGSESSEGNLFAGEEVGVGGEAGADSEAAESALADAGVVDPASSSQKAAKPAVSSISKNSSAAKGDEGAADGVGGAEIDCETDASACGKQLSQLSGTRARLNLASAEGRAADQKELIELLDTYLDVLKIAPIGLPAPGYINSGFGFRFSPFHGRLSMHEGIDLALPQGSQINSTGDGVVLSVERNGTYGLVVDIAHSDRVVTRYAHLSKAFVSEGEKVCRGEVIGLVGTSGRSTGPHLHYEILVDGKARNPVPFVQLALDIQNLFGRLTSDLA